MVNETVMKVNGQILFIGQGDDNFRPLSVEAYFGRHVLIDGYEKNL